ncbi:MAG: glutathione peroxidase [Saprospiraceae bacterium]|nr:glutathione peroxidase [Bacteroidia bacterium]NNF21824.1 glutathione peroxidase [Saprospiraceae bacterium]NNK90244.1 glutathione peroxidase [Saprospiraceae bacterium]
MKFALFIISMIFMYQIQAQTSVHDFKIEALNSDQIIDFKQFEGKKILVVNVASKCGFTYQYEGLEALYQKYKDELVVIGFPCNQFLGQEPGTEEKIASFCSSKYGVTFPMTQKIKVKGKEANEIYKWLTTADLNGKADYKISWNFNKFLLDENGQIIEHFGSKVKPMDEAITRHLN